MAAFNDSKGREWSVEITIGTTMRLKSDGVQFHELAENKCEKYLALEHDDESLIMLLWGIVKPQADAKDITKDDFVNSVYGESLQAAWEVFKAAYINFTRNPAIRSFLVQTNERSKKLQALAAKTMTEKMESMERIGQAMIAERAQAMDEAKMRGIIDEQIAKTSTPPSPSDSSSALPVS